MRKRSFCVLLFALGLYEQAFAQGLLVDQSLQPPAFIPGESYHYDAAEGTLFPATGQEFTPAFSGLDFVSVNLESVIPTNIGNFQIAIHSGGITGPVLGLSEDVTSPASGFPNQTALFTFANMVPLTPGDTYVFELVELSASNPWYIQIPGSAVVNGQPIDMNYPGGRLIYNGVPQDTEDMIFSEGIIVPEPTAPELALLGLLVFGFVKKNPFRGSRKG
jgi:hypothetical protein